jgi:hypothetical protein
MFIVNNKPSSSASQKIKPVKDFLVASHENLFFDIVLANPFSFDVEVHSIEIMYGIFVLVLWI